MSTTKRLRINIYGRIFYLFAVLLIIYTLLRLGFYWANLSLFPDISLYSLLVMLLGGVKFDIPALLYINSLFIALQAIPFRFRYQRTYQNISKWLFIITNSIGIALNLAQEV